MGKTKKRTPFVDMTLMETPGHLWIDDLYAKDRKDLGVKARKELTSKRGHDDGMNWAFARIVELNLATPHLSASFVAGAVCAEIDGDYAGIVPAKDFMKSRSSTEIHQAFGEMSAAQLALYSEGWREGATAACVAFDRMKLDELETLRKAAHAANELPAWKRDLVRIRLSTAGVKGRCVRAAVDIKRGELIELVPVLIIQNKDIKGRFSTGYPFQWGRGVSALALGLGSIYNHSFDPNAVYYQDHDKCIMRFYARRNIRRGQEITVNYNGDPEDQAPVWFEVR
ncbi:MAG: SET domain-containing protein-lysine N-methyltransferase [Polyangiales bacterium]